MDRFAARRAAFRALHASGCFLLPNPWDAGTARFMEARGCVALATTSSGAAHAEARADGALDLEATLANIAAIVAATSLPVNADFSHGFGEDAASVGANVARCVATGVAGLSIEDATGDAARPLFPVAEAALRLRAARQAIDASGADVLLVGRAECFLTGHPDPLGESLARIAAYAGAGADVLYVPGLTEAAQISAVVRAAGGLPVNVLVHRPIGLDFAQIAALGVRRISVGGALAGVAWGAMARALAALQAGDFAVLADRLPGAELNRLFGDGA